MKIRTAPTKHVPITHVQFPIMGIIERKSADTDSQPRTHPILELPCKIIQNFSTFFFLKRCFLNTKWNIHNYFIFVRCAFWIQIKKSNQNANALNKAKNEEQKIIWRKST